MRALPSCKKILPLSLRRPTVTPPAPTCEGKTSTISSTDTCVNISMREGISTDDLLSYNSLSSFCHPFPKEGESLCIPDSRKCEPYTVLETDTCKSLQKQFGISYSQLISWNPSLGPKCNNIASYVDYVICGSNPGGNWVNPNPPPSTTTTTLG